MRGHIHLTSWQVISRLCFLSSFLFSCSACGQTDRGRVNIMLTDADSGAPISGAKVELKKLYPGFFPLDSYPSKVYEGRTNAAGAVSFANVIRSTTIGPKIFSTYLRISMDGYFALYQQSGEPVPEVINLKLRKRPSSAPLPQGHFSLWGREPTLWRENEKTAFGFQFARNQYSEDLQNADIVVQLKIFPDEESSRPILQGHSLLTSYQIIPVDREVAGPTTGRRVKFAWSLEAGPGAQLTSVPQQQTNSFQALDECNFQNAPNSVSLFPQTQKSLSEMTDLFCVRTKRGEVVKFLFTFPSIKWVMQTDGTNRVLSTISDPALNEF